MSPNGSAFGPGLYAKNYDGSGFKQLTYRSGQQFVTEVHNTAPLETLPWNTIMMRQDGAQDSNFAYVISPQYDAKGEVLHVELLRLNTVTGRSHPVDGPPHAMRWVLDQRGEPAMAVTAERDETSIYYRAPAAKAWKKVAGYNLYAGNGGYSPLAFGPDGTLYVLDSAGKDKQSVYAMDVATGKINRRRWSRAPITTSMSISSWDASSCSALRCRPTPTPPTGSIRP